MLLGKLSASLLGNILAGKGAIEKRQSQKDKGWETISTGHNNKMSF